MNAIALVISLTLLTCLTFSIVDGQLSSADITTVYNNLTPLARQQGDWCGLKEQLASTSHVGWKVADILTPLQVIFSAYTNVKPEMTTTTWLCDTIKVWTLVVDQAYSKRSCQNDKWCSVNYSDLVVPYPKPAYCTATYCGKYPGATCTTAAEWKGKCIVAKNRCPIVCFHIRGTNYAAYQSFTQYLYTLTWNYKKKQLNSQIKRILALSSSSSSSTANEKEEEEEEEKSTGVRGALRRLRLSSVKNNNKRSSGTEEQKRKNKRGTVCDMNTEQCGWCEPSTTSDCGSVCSSSWASTGDPCMYSGKCCICIIY